MQVVELKVHRLKPLYYWSICDHDNDIPLLCACFLLCKIRGWVMFNPCSRKIVKLRTGRGWRMNTLGLITVTPHYGRTSQGWNMQARQCNKENSHIKNKQMNIGNLGILKVRRTTPSSTYCLPTGLSTFGKDYSLSLGKSPLQFSSSWMNTFCQDDLRL